MAKDSKQKKKKYPYQTKRATPKHDKEYIGESKNKEFAKQKIDGKVYVFSIDKKSGIEKRMTYKAYQSHKKNWNVGQSSRLLQEAKEATNGIFGKRVWYKKDEDNTYEYKKFIKTDSKGRKKVYFLELETTTEYKDKPTRLLTFKQATGHFIKLQKNRSMKMLLLSGYTKEEAEKKYKENQENLYNTRIKHIQEHKGYTKQEAKQYYKKLVSKGDFGTLKAYNYDGWRRLDQRV